MRDEFFPKSWSTPTGFSGLDALVKEAVTLKFIDKQLTQQQLAEPFNSATEVVGHIDCLSTQRLSSPRRRGPIAVSPQCGTTADS